jgi:hypothetical protein
MFELPVNTILYLKDNKSDDINISVIRRIVYDIYTQEETVLTVWKLLTELKETISFNGGSTSLKLILRKVGFKWKKTRNNRGT